MRFCLEFVWRWPEQLVRRFESASALESILRPFTRGLLMLGRPRHVRMDITTMRHMLVLLMATMDLIIL
jgi:hypothetical protein